MLLYRLAIQRIIEYLKLDQLWKEDETRLLLLHKKPKVSHKVYLNTDQTLNFYISVLLSVIGMILCFSMPFAMLETPSSIFADQELNLLKNVVETIHEYFIVVDITIVFLIVMLILVTCKTIFDGIRNTNISVSPWVEKGKYFIPNAKRNIKRYYK